jgi:hypothetical protein
LDNVDEVIVGIVFTNKLENVPFFVVLPVDVNFLLNKKTNDVNQMVILVALAQSL